MQPRATGVQSRRGRVVLLVAALMLAGCASYRLEPLSASHPAHPEAADAPEAAE